jgi:hypothetical protein
MENMDFEHSKWLPGGHLTADQKIDGTRRMSAKK